MLHASSVTVPELFFLRHVRVVAGHDFAHRNAGLNFLQECSFPGNQLFRLIEDGFDVFDGDEHHAAAVGDNPIAGTYRNVTHRDGAVEIGFDDASAGGGGN